MAAIFHRIFYPHSTLFHGYLSIVFPNIIDGVYSNIAFTPITTDETNSIISQAPQAPKMLEIFIEQLIFKVYTGLYNQLDQHSLQPLNQYYKINIQNPQIMEIVFNKIPYQEENVNKYYTLVRDYIDTYFKTNTLTHYYNDTIITIKDITDPDNILTLEKSDIINTYNNPNNPTEIALEYNDKYYGKPLTKIFKTSSPADTINLIWNLNDYVKQWRSQSRVPLECNHIIQPLAPLAVDIV